MAIGDAFIRQQGSTKHPEERSLGTGALPLRPGEGNTLEDSVLLLPPVIKEVLARFGENPRIAIPLKELEGRFLIESSGNPNDQTLQLTLQGLLENGERFVLATVGFKNGRVNATFDVEANRPMTYSEAEAFLGWSESEMKNLISS